MTKRFSAFKISVLPIIGLLLICVVGVLLRLYHITRSDFIFYDEGLYLNYNNYYYVGLLHGHVPHGMFWRAVWGMVQVSLASGKALWFVMADSRFFFGGYHDWFIPRVIASVAGIFTLWLVYLFAARFSGSRRTGLLAAALLAVLPSHVFYSRLALQETFSTMCFVGAFYLYLFPRRFGWRAFAAGALFAATYFTNYRMIILPVHIVVAEGLLSLEEKRWPDFRKLVWTVLTYVALVVIIGGLDRGQNTQVTFAWMFHQSDLAKHQFDWVNFLSYPYYLIVLDNVLFAFLFFGNIVYLFRRQWMRALPFTLAAVQMTGFSLAADKGARYICVVLPFAAIAVALAVADLWRAAHMRRAGRPVVAVVVCLMLAAMMGKSFLLAGTDSQYRDAVRYLKNKDPRAKIMTSQNFILDLYVKDQKDVVAVPHGFAKFVRLYRQGYRYLVLGPQAYVSWTSNGEHFNPRLASYLGFIDRTVRPVKAFRHFSPIVLERFVFEQSENLRQSIAFLRLNGREHGRLGSLRVYDVRACLEAVKQAIGREPHPPARVEHILQRGGVQ